MEPEVYRKLGRQFEYAIKNDKLDFIERKINMNPIYNQVISKLDSLNIDANRYNKGATVKKQVIFNRFNQQLKLIQKQVQSGAKFEFIKYYQKNRPHLLFGLASDNNLEFIDFELLSLGDNTFIVDLFFSYHGLKLSESILWDEVNKRYYGYLGGRYINAQEELQNAMGYLQRGQPDRALIAFQRIPEEFAYQQHFHLVKQQISASLSDSLYLETLNEKISYNWDKKQTRYMNIIEFYDTVNEPYPSEQYSEKTMRDFCI